MQQVEVRILREGREIARVKRPLRRVDGEPAVRYKGRFWPLVNGGEVYLDDVPPRYSVQTQDVADRDRNDSESDVQVVPPALIKWDKSQREVIQAPQQDRLLVGAGPGTGKTAVACARVSKLIDQDGLEPSRVWLVSFTRAAVREVRDRLAVHLENASVAYAVKVATLDSHAWAVHSGFDEDARILGSYEENIERMLELVRQDDNVVEYLESVEHVIVDEAQDIVGVRSELVVEIVRKLSSSCGVTAFADEAQAIYGFADDQEVPLGSVAEPSFVERVRSGEAGPFQECELTAVYRTGERNLLTIFTDTRRKVLAASDESTDKLDEVRADIVNLAHGPAPSVDGVTVKGLDQAFILYRRRCDVLLTSSFLVRDGIRHRVRMSGLPVCLAPWIGAALARHTEPTLNRSRFDDLWTESVQGTALQTCDSDFAWTSLVRLAGRSQSVVDMDMLRQRLARRSPPAELCQADFGSRGPIVGTIHASKGRETDVVHLMLPHAGGRGNDQDEEARVAFVGATRGRSRLLTGRGYRQYVRRIDGSGRVFSPKKGRKAQVELGRDTDIEARGLADRRFFPDLNAVHAAQERIRGFTQEYVSLVAESDPEADFAYRLKVNDGGQCIAVLSQGVNADLFKVARFVQARNGSSRMRPPSRIRHLHVHGVRTVVLPSDAPELETLHTPWRESGIMLAPLVLGYSTVTFPYMHKRRGT